MFASFAQQPPPLPPAATQQKMFHLPSQPSPLSPRSSNIQSSRPPLFSMSSPSQPPKPIFSEQNTLPTRRTTTTTTNRPSSYAQRYAERISNPAANITRRRSPTSPASSSTTPTTTTTSRQRPLLSSSSSSTSPRDKRRDIFLNRVKRDREEGRFEARADQILRMDYLAQRRRYEEVMARSAPDLVGVVDEEGEGEEELDEFLAEETEMGMGMEEGGGGGGCGVEMVFDDDGEDYDSIFMDMLSSQGVAGESSPQFSQSMDTSGG